MIAPDLPPQTSINPAADLYAETSLMRSAGITRIADIAFGADPAQRLDVYLPKLGAGSDSLWPVLIFWHGGGFTHGHKEWCGFMAPALNALPAILVAANYRLMPNVGSEDQMDDARAALCWVTGNIARFGGDPDHVVIGGHSAGANIAARLELDCDRRRAAGIADGAIKAVLPLSGSYFTPTSNRNTDESLHLPAGRPDCPADFAYASGAPFTVAWGTMERAPFPENGESYVTHLTRQGVRATGLPVAEKDHFGVHLASGDPKNPYFRAIAQALRKP